MTIINAKDLDAQMGRGLPADVNVNARPGATTGAMQERFLPQSDEVRTEQGYGRRGAAVVEGQQLPGVGYYGSGTVVTLSGAEALPPKLEPKPIPVPGAAAIPTPPAAATAPASAPPGLSANAAALLSKLGMKPKQ